MRHERISESLHANPDRTMAEVQTVSFGRRVIVHADDLVEVVCDGFGHFVEFVEVIFLVGDEGGEGERGEVAYGCFVGGGVSDDFSAKVRLDSAKVLLIGFACRSWLL
jgi:hypothetical protein